MDHISYHTWIIDDWSPILRLYILTTWRNTARVQWSTRCPQRSTGHPTEYKKLTFSSADATWILSRSDTHRRHETVHIFQCFREETGRCYTNIIIKKRFIINSIKIGHEFIILSGAVRWTTTSVLLRDC